VGKDSSDYRQGQNMKIDSEALAQLPFEVRAEIAENVERLDFKPSEIDVIRKLCEDAIRKQAKARQGTRTDKHGGKFPRGSPGKTRDKIGALVNVSGKTVEKIAAIVEAAKAEPEKFGKLLTEMDRTGKVNAAHRELRRAEDEKRILGLTPANGKFKTLTIDPPWKYDTDFAGRGRPDYACMTHEELLALPVEAWAEENCHLYSWTTNAMFPDANELRGRWGFRHNTVLTWAKPKYGLGTHFRGQTEHVIFAIRGSLAGRSKSISTLFEAPVGKHSEKPEKFYEIVRAASYPPYGEAFQRTARPDFVTLFEGEAPSDAAADAPSATGSSRRSDKTKCRRC
jgi:N6-adenosine-specific RNA methylase IME4